MSAGLRWLGGVLTTAILIVDSTHSSVAEECRVVAGFAQNTVGEFPSDWKPKEEQARTIYRVMEENGARFVRATAEGTGLQMGKDFEWDLGTTPMLKWKWRPQLFPSGSDERQSGRNDSVVGVYAVFPHTPFTVKTVKYVWSLAVPVGTTASASMGRTRMIVLRSGQPTDSGWVEETVNVVSDYRRLFGEAPKRALGIAVLTDADDTKGRAVGDYAAFKVCPAGSPPVGSGALRNSPPVLQALGFPDPQGSTSRTGAILK